MGRMGIMGAVLLVAGTAWGAPLELQGVYQFRGQLNPLARRTIDVIDARLPDSEARLKMLQAAGAQCQNASGVTTRCLSFGRASDIPRASLDRVARQNQGLRIELMARVAAPSVVSKGDILTEWEIRQKGRWNGGLFDRYRYFEMAGGMVKLQLPGPGEGLWLVVENAKLLRHYDSVVTTESRWRWHIDAVEALLEK
ncbi:MAG: hypothetical protein KF802_06290 [Bdellovibrionaceae bacterium]|nr:hypothetical protein [Pseudobdellovibrionaceae bacterium]MBX3032531.1 hypothetical protein [Pseudobdellovibrionaceae bacterium]